MRNLSQYPITREEILAALDAAIEDELAKQLIGGIRPAALVEAKRIVEASMDVSPEGDKI